VKLSKNRQQTPFWPVFIKNRHFPAFFRFFGVRKAFLNAFSTLLITFSIVLNIFSRQLNAFSSVLNIFSGQLIASSSVLNVSSSQLNGFRSVLNGFSSQLNGFRIVLNVFRSHLKALSSVLNVIRRQRIALSWQLIGFSGQGNLFVRRANPGHGHWFRGKPQRQGLFRRRCRHLLESAHAGGSAPLLARFNALVGTRQH